MNETRSAYPLDWPAGWKRARSRTYGKFHKQETVSSADGQSSYQRKKGLSVNDGVNRILESLQRMGISQNDVVISTNLRLRLDGFPRSDQPKPADPGAVVYWRKAGKPVRCMAIDQYTTVEDNLAAIAATLEALRAIERHGGAEILERSFSGFAALPEKASEPWRDVLKFGAEDRVSKEIVEYRFREFARTHHPDVGGDRDQFEAIVRARQQAIAELG